MICSGVCVLRLSWMIGLRSFFMTFIHGGFPLLFFAGLRASSSVFLTGVCLSIHIMCPSHFSRLRLIRLLHFSALFIWYRFTDKIFFGNLILTACRSILLWKESICFSIVAVSVHNSELYRKTDNAKVYKVLIFTWMLCDFDL